MLDEIGRLWGCGGGGLNLFEGTGADNARVAFHIEHRRGWDCFGGVAAAGADVEGEGAADARLRRDSYLSALDLGQLSRDEETKATAAVLDVCAG